jgi:nitroreductase
MVMELIEGLKTRTSMRAFTKTPVPKEIIAEILSEAHRAPSSSNQQPWNFHVITGKPLEALCTKILAAHGNDRKPYDPSKGRTIPAQYVEKTKTLFRELRPFLQKLGEENLSFIETGSLRFYNAPVAILLTIHNSFPRNRLMDIGMAAQNLMLAAHARGLGTCAIGFALFYEDIIRAEIAISSDFDLTLMIALGYPDYNSPVNDFRSSRDELSDCVSWIGFE